MILCCVIAKCTVGLIDFGPTVCDCYKLPVYINNMCSALLRPI